MKLVLTQKEEITILAFNGALDEKNVAVIQSGTKKLFSDGKNKMVFDVTQLQGVTGDLLRKFSEMNLTARELSGEVVLLNTTATEKQRLEKLVHARSLSVFGNLESALKFFKQNPAAKGPASAATPPAAGALPEGTGDQEAFDIIAKKDEEIKKLREQLQEKEKGELGKIKQENTRLKELTTTLEQSLLEKLKSRVIPTEDQAIHSKVKSLEDRIKKLAARVEEESKGGGAAPAAGGAAAAAPAAKK